MQEFAIAALGVGAQDAVGNTALAGRCGIGQSGGLSGVCLKPLSLMIVNTLSADLYHAAVLY
jgi:dihydroorotate dehydrogenase